MAGNGLLATPLDKQVIGGEGIHTPHCSGSGSGSGSGLPLADAIRTGGRFVCPKYG